MANVLIICLMAYLQVPMRSLVIFCAFALCVYAAPPSKDDAEENVRKKIAQTPFRLTLSMSYFNERMFRRLTEEVWPIKHSLESNYHHNNLKLGGWKCCLFPIQCSHSFVIGISWCTRKYQHKVRLSLDMKKSTENF